MQPTKRDTNNFSVSSIDKPIQAGIINDYKTFLRFPTISSDSSQKRALQDCAGWLYTHLKKIGMARVSIIQTAGHPIVYAEHISDPLFKTILFYGHYDVQPVSPLEKWKHPPFDPVIHKDYMYARGASDDKGQMFVHIKAIEIMLKSITSPGVNIKCLFEGEEEIGSPHLYDFIINQPGLLQCNVVVVSDTKMLSRDIPAITYSLRGSLNAEIILRGGNRDLHSGSFGGMVHSPADVLSRIAGKINHRLGKVMIPGFYDGIIPESEAERKFMQQYGPADNLLFADAGTHTTWGEAGYSNYEKTTIRPSVVISTLQAGHTGEGIKNVIPSVAVAKINMRLVKGQYPAKIAELFSTFINQYIPTGFTCNINYSSAVYPVEVSRNQPYLKAAADAYTKVFGNRPVLLRSGGTIPVVSLFHTKLKAPLILMGFARGTDNMHAPDEKFYLPNLWRGIKTSIQFMKNISTV